MENVWGTRGEVGGSPLADPLNLGRIFSCLVTKSCLILCNPVDCSPPVSSCPWNFPAKTLEWVAISFSKGSSHPGLKSTSPALAGGFFSTSYMVRKRELSTWQEWQRNYLIITRAGWILVPSALWKDQGRSCDLLTTRHKSQRASSLSTSSRMAGSRFSPNHTTWGRSRPPHPGSSHL